ncbi:uncharacterized protein LOC130188505 [Pseudoliparis swirei]|uniref:uncharacterized protein LOC130188505 n=1 Tax=Pseudoliparis swirei TaxID=2059687 RepID=UPI0024BD7073|nr:uncharacterized protein LOC130188505 [Pseudoliparis swirei]
MAAADSELKKILTELNHLSLKRQQLLERKKFQSIFHEMKNRAEFVQTEEAATNLHQIDIIDDTLTQLTERKAELQKSHDNILDAKDMNKEASIASCQVEPGGPLPVPVPLPLPCVVFVEGPPNIPAPVVFLDLEHFPACPCRTQCPECKQFIVTETFTSVSSVTWLVCFITALIGGVAGCCFIPFCMKRFKSITHRCPKCRTEITTLKKL